MPSSRAASPKRSAYVGVHMSTVASVATIAATRSVVVIAPPVRHIAPRRSAPANADQNPTNGPNENAKKMRSRAVTPAARYIGCQHSRHHSHDSAVSRTRSGLPVVPLV